MANEELPAIVRASHVFTPGAPVNSKALFSGRADQLRRVIETIPAPGRHPIIYGQRGVGKTSLANIIRDVVENLLAVKISATPRTRLRDSYLRSPVALQLKMPLNGTGMRTRKPQQQPSRAVIR